MAAHAAAVQSFGEESGEAKQVNLRAQDLVKNNTKTKPIPLRVLAATKALYRKAKALDEAHTGLADLEDQMVVL